MAKGAGTFPNSIHSPKGLNHLNVLFMALRNDAYSKYKCSIQSPKTLESIERFT